MTTNSPDDSTAGFAAGEPWEEDPIVQLPDVIEPGRFSVTIWSPTPWDDGHIENIVSISWDGKTTIEWHVLSGSGLSMMSEVSSSGIAGWPNGRDVILNYTGDSGGRGVDWLPGAAPISDDSSSSTDPQLWVRLAHALVGLTDELLDSGGEPGDEIAAAYYDTASEDWLDFDGIFVNFLASADDAGILPDFDEWLTAALAAGTYQLDEP